ncbi:MAG: hypothetical protein IH991_04495 [Planctomycetes bacterium]|nr:hypothetical protein [Planctomycetota bacterium]
MTRHLTAGAASTAILWFAASMAVAVSAPAQEKAKNAKPVGVVKATIYLGPFE